LLAASALCHVLPPPPPQHPASEGCWHGACECRHLAPGSTAKPGRTPAAINTIVTVFSGCEGLLVCPACLASTCGWAAHPAVAVAAEEAATQEVTHACAPGPLQPLVAQLACLLSRPGRRPQPLSPLGDILKTGALLGPVAASLPAPARGSPMPAAPREQAMIARRGSANNGEQMKQSRLSTGVASSSLAN